MPEQKLVFCGKTVTSVTTSAAVFALFFCCLCTSVKAQTAAFTYQGRFTDSTQTQPTSGSYNMQFVLFSTANAGTQIGAVLTKPAVQVTNGVFTDSLDFGVGSFNGSDRFLEVGHFKRRRNVGRR